MFRTLKRTNDYRVDLQSIIINLDDFFKILKIIKDKNILTLGDTEKEYKVLDLLPNNIDSSLEKLAKELENSCIRTRMKIYMVPPVDGIGLNKELFNGEVKPNLLNYLNDKVKDLDIQFKLCLDSQSGYNRFVFFKIITNDGHYLPLLYLECPDTNVANLINKIKDKDTYNVTELVDSIEIKIKVPKFEMDDNGEIKKSGEEEKDVEIYFSNKSDKNSKKMKLKIYLITDNNNKYLIIEFYKKNLAKVYFASI